MTPDELNALADRVDALAWSGSNELDVQTEVALFKPDKWIVSIRANSAGTKVIYTYRDGRKSTFWARDWTNFATRQEAAAALRALAVERMEK